MSAAPRFLVIRISKSFGGMASGMVWEMKLWGRSM